jgi:uncharacterized protein YbjT (DUF2867 family)
LKIVVIGGTGLIGSRLVAALGAEGHEAIPASPRSGVDTLTGAGLPQVLDGADVVVDVSNPPSSGGITAATFFETSTRNLLAADGEVGVAHHVALSVVGTARLAESGYFRGKIAQERLIGESTIPHTILQATQFFEFLARIADDATVGDTIRLPPVLIQPVAVDDVVEAVGRIAVASPLGRTVEIAGPERFRLDQVIRDRLSDVGDPRHVVTDPEARYYGAVLEAGTLLPGADADLGRTRLRDWVQPGRQ